MSSSVATLTLALALACGGATAQPPAQPEALMSILGGTQNIGGQENSFGNVMPDVTLPWAFSAWAPTNDITSGGGWWFYSGSTHLAGIRCTHQPSTWVGDYAFLNVMMHAVDPAHDGRTSQYANYDPRASTWLPYLFNATLTPYGSASGIATIEVTPTTHGAVMRFSFPPSGSGPLVGSYNATRRVLISLRGSAGNGVNLTGAGTAASPLVFSGVATDGLGSGGGLHFAATLLGGGGATPAAPLAMGAGQDNGNVWAWADFDQRDAAAEVLVLRIATSLISPAQALAAHAAEVAGASFDATMAAAQAVWHAQATRLTVADVGPGYTPAETADLLTTMYSALYRASKFPRALYEVDYATGQPMHWSPYSGQVLPGVLSADFGFWDGYRTTYSLLALIRPDYSASSLEGFLNAWRENNGIVPQWPHPSGGGMDGTFSDVAFSEGVVKLPHCGTARAAAAGYCVNASALYAASRVNAFSRSNDYMTLGYNSIEFGGPTVSDTLGMRLCDWSVAQAATLLGQAADAAELLARAANFTALLEPTTAFMRPRFRNGSYDVFDEFAWGAAYTEAGPWQYRLEVPYDPQGLKAALAAIGVDACGVVQAANTILPTYHAGGYGGVIHEMAEMSENCWAQFELNNQPVWAQQHMQVGFDSTVTGRCASQAQYWLRRSTTLFHPTAAMFPGDEDNGSMGSWHILNAIGLYPLSPASGDYVLGSPLFANVTIALDGAAAPLTVLAVNQGPENVYVQGVTWNGAPVAGVTMPYASLMLGGELKFTMASTPAAPDADVMPPFHAAAAAAAARRR